MSASPTEPRKAKDKAIVVIAARQHGLLTRVQLLGAGLSDGMVKRRLKAGQLRAVHRGVYLLGPLFPPQARLLSAVLACGDGAVVSHRSAARLWELLGGREATVDVTIPRADHRRPGPRAEGTPAGAGGECQGCRP